MGIPVALLGRWESISSRSRPERLWHCSRRGRERSVLDVGGGHGQLTGPLVDAGFAVTVYGSEAVCGERIRAFTEGSRAGFRHGSLLAHAVWRWSLRCRRVVPSAPPRGPLAGAGGRDGTSGSQGGPRGLSRPGAASMPWPTRSSVSRRESRRTRAPSPSFRDRDVVDAFGAHGWEPSARRPEFFFPMALHRALRSRRISSALEGVAGAFGLVRLLGSPVLLRLEHRG